MKRVIIILFILSVVIGGGVAGYIYLKPQTYDISTDPTVEIIDVVSNTIIGTVNASGRLQALESVDATFASEGQITDVFVSVGDEVAADTILAQLDRTDLTYAIRLAELDLDNAQSQLDKLLEPSLQADIDSATASLRSAQASRDRLNKGPLASDITAAQAALDSARANLRELLRDPDPNSLTVAVANLRKAEIALTEAQANYDAVAYDSRAAVSAGKPLEQATIDYETALANYNLAVKSPSNAEIVAAQSQVAQAEANLNKLLETVDQAEIITAESQITQAEASLQKLLQGPSEADLRTAQTNIYKAAINLARAESNLERTVLLSPMAGIVTAVNMEPAQFTKPDTKVSLVDLSQFKLQVDIDEIDINQVRVGQPRCHYFRLFAR